MAAMPARLILYPVLVQVLLTMAVYVLLNMAKRKAVGRGEVDEARRALDEDAWPDSVRKINNNIRNQFEVPVLFYVLALTLVAINAVNIVALVLAWLFVLSRIAHVYIHVGSNYVPVRRRVFMAGCIAIVALAVDVAWVVIAR
jgi:hypothetical protein